MKTKRGASFQTACRGQTIKVMAKLQRETDVANVLSQMSQLFQHQVDDLTKSKKGKSNSKEAYIKAQPELKIGIFFLPVYISSCTPENQRWAVSYLFILKIVIR